MDGFFSFLLSVDEATGVTISNNDTVANNCYIIRNGEPLSLECVTGETEERRSFVNITCTRAVFGNDGTAEGDIFEFRIKGLTNPRLKNMQSFFKLYTMDAKYRYIDEN